MRRTRAAAAVLAVLTVVAACGGGSVDPRALVAAGRRALEGASAFHFRLEATGLPTSMTVLTGGDGDLVRPGSFRGRMLITRGGLTFPLEAVAVGDAFWAKPPFASTYERTDPAKYGFGNPTRLLDPHLGVTRLLTDAQGLRFTGRHRFRGEVLDEVAVRLPGAVVADVLADADPSRDVPGTIGFAGRTHQVRRVVLTGPFYRRGVDSTFTLVLDHYGERVDIRAPG